MEAVSEIKEEKVPQVKAEEKPTEQKERYFCIKLAAMRGKEDIEQPTITVGNKTTKHPRIQFKRQKWVPVTGSHIEVLRNTKHTIWLTEEIDGKRRKTPQERVRFPIDDSIEITKEGYDALRAKNFGFTNDTQEIKEADINQYRV